MAEGFRNAIRRFCEELKLKPEGEEDRGDNEGIRNGEHEGTAEGLSAAPLVSASLC